MTSDSEVRSGNTPVEDQLADAIEVLEMLADHAVVVVHYLLDYSGKESAARQSAEMLLSLLRTEVAGVLKDKMPNHCPTCGSSHPPSSPRHASRCPHP